VTIPSSVTEIGAVNIFDNCTGLTDIQVESGNQNYTAENGVLFTKTMEDLVSYPAGKQGTYAIPSGVTSIRGHAFSGCAGLTSVTIPGSVTWIGGFAFSGCRGLTSVIIPNSVIGIGAVAFDGCAGLTSVTIPNSVTLIEAEAFRGCSSLKDVYYGGSKEQWDAIDIGEAGDFKEGLTSATIHYNGTGPEPATNYNVDQALEYARKNWNSGQGACAEFVSRCVEAGGLKNTIQKGTGGCYREIINKSGLSMQMLVTRTENGAVNVYQSDNIDRLAPGDVVIQWCNTHNIAPHVLICGGFNRSGIATFYAHNGAKNNQTFRFDYKRSGKIPSGHTKNCDMTAYVIHLSSLDSNAYNNQLASAKIKSDCPVELLVTVDGNILDSRTINGRYVDSSTGTEMITSGSGNNRTIEVSIPGEYIHNHKANVEFMGTDVGKMSLSVEFTYDNNHSEKYAFQNVALSEVVTGYLENMQPGQMVRLIKQDDAEAENPDVEVWTAYPGETIANATPSRISNEEKVDIDEETDGAGNFIPSTVFSDVPSDAWYYDAVYWAVENKITNGTSPTTFTPDRTCITTEIITLLWRAAGEPSSNAQLPFTVDSSLSYAEGALRWACEKGMIGSGFDQSAPCTRSSAVKYIWQAMGKPDAAYDGQFSDVAATADYATAVAWAVNTGVTTGTGTDAAGKPVFSPDATCTRGHIVTFLYRAYNQ